MKDPNQSGPFGRTFGEEPPPPESKAFYPLVSPKPNQEAVVLIASERPVSCWKHYCDGVSYPCVRTKDCPFCRKHVSPRWIAYVAAYDTLTGKACIAELTAGAVHSCKLLSDPDVNLRGKLLKMSRKGRAPNSPVVASVVEVPESMRKWKLPAAFDVRVALLRMWGNPFEMVDPVAGEVKDEPPEDQLIPC